MSISANVFLICRISMEQSPKLCERLIHYYLQLRNGASESNVTWVDIALIFLVATDMPADGMTTRIAFPTPFDSSGAARAD